VAPRLRARAARRVRFTLPHAARAPHAVLLAPTPMPPAAYRVCRVPHTARGPRPCLARLPGSTRARSESARPSTAYPLLRPTCLPHWPFPTRAESFATLPRSTRALSCASAAALPLFRGGVARRRCAAPWACGEVGPASRAAAQQRWAAGSWSGAWLARARTAGEEGMAVLHARAHAGVCAQHASRADRAIARRTAAVHERACAARSDAPARITPRLDRPTIRGAARGGLRAQAPAGLLVMRRCVRAESGIR
jgi:hypothetical protein